ncbi:hypothetical protein C2G38_2117316 [Gigaspora rosea]|uniref:Uncharacterized protein n=1 Tax=Gigaspora rosea TaxID=44941 RepID=A0A397UF34_9GLOM|nr:hypothetical protein C2G38_2117316 [Gigaspora rosea]
MNFWKGRNILTNRDIQSLHHSPNTEGIESNYWFLRYRHLNSLVRRESWEEIGWYKTHYSNRLLDREIS